MCVVRRDGQLEGVGACCGKGGSVRGGGCVLMEGTVS